MKANDDKPIQIVKDVNTVSMLAKGNNLFGKWKYTYMYTGISLFCTTTWFILTNNGHLHKKNPIKGKYKFF